MKWVIPTSMHVQPHTPTQSLRATYNPLGVISQLETAIEMPLEHSTHLTTRSLWKRWKNYICIRKSKELIQLPEFSIMKIYNFYGRKKNAKAASEVNLEWK